MDLGTLAQWAGFVVTASVAAFGAARVVFTWQDKKNVEVYERIDKTARHNTERIEAVRTETLGKCQLAEIVARRASAELAEFKVKVANDYLPKAEFDRALDRHFTQLFVRISTMESKLERFIESRMKL